MSADPRTQYFVIKRTYAGLVPDTGLASDSYVPSGAGTAYDLEDCSTGGDYLGLSNDPIVALAGLAYDVVRLRKTLVRLGYPESVWRPLLVQFENE